MEQEAELLLDFFRGSTIRSERDSGFAFQRIARSGGCHIHVAFVWGHQKMSDIECHWRYLLGQYAKHLTFDFRAEAGSVAYSHPLKQCWSEMNFKLALRFGAAERDGDGRSLNALSICEIGKGENTFLRTVEVDSIDIHGIQSAVTTRD